MRHTTLKTFIAALMTAALATSCDGMLVSTGVSTDYDPYYYDGWPGNWYGQLTAPPIPTWAGIGWNPGPPPRPPRPSNVPHRPVNPDGPQHFIPAQPPSGGGSIFNPPSSAGGTSGQRPPASRPSRH